MELTHQMIVDEFKANQKAKKYWLVFIIMSIVFLLIGACGGNIYIGIFMIIIMGIVILVMKTTASSTFKNIKKGNYEVVIDSVTNKEKKRHTSDRPTDFYIYTEKVYQTPLKTTQDPYNSVEVGDQIAIVLVKNELVKFYNLNGFDRISPEVQQKVRRQQQ